MKFVTVNYAFCNYMRIFKEILKYGKAMVETE